MSLMRSASGPGALSINTGAANALGTNSSQPPAPGGLFGSSTAATQPAPQGGFFGSATTTATTQPTTTTATAGGLFGASAANTTQPAQTGGLFGNTTTAATTTTQPATGGLFGSAMAQPTQQTGGGLFGQQPQAAQPQAGGLFGQAQQQPAQVGGGLFGQAQQTQQQQQQPGGLFGAKPVATGGFFGASTQQQARPSLFGAQQPTANPFGQTMSNNLTMGQVSQQQLGGQAAQSAGQAQQAAAIPGARIDASNIKGTTRFNDLHVDIQRELEFIDTTIYKIMAFKDEIDAFLPQHEADVLQVAKDVEFLQKKHDAVKAVLDDDVRVVKQLQDLTKQNVEDCRVSFRAIDNLRLPSHYHTTGLWVSGGGSSAAHATAPAGAGGSGNPGDVSAGASQLDSTGQDILAFYQRHTDKLASRLAKLKERLVEVQQHMPGVEAGLYERVRAANDAGYVPDNPAQMIIGALNDTHNAILAQAENVAAARQKLVELQLSTINGVSAINRQYR